MNRLEHTEQVIWPSSLCKDVVAILAGTGWVADLVAQEIGVGDVGGRESEEQKRFKLIDIQIQ